MLPFLQFHKSASREHSGKLKIKKITIPVFRHNNIGFIRMERRGLESGVVLLGGEMVELALVGMDIYEDFSG